MKIITNFLFAQVAIVSLVSMACGQQTYTISGTDNFDTSLGTLLSVRIRLDPPNTQSTSAGEHSHTINPPSVSVTSQFPPGTVIDFLPIQLGSQGHNHSLNIPAFSVNGISVNPPSVTSSISGDHIHIIDFPPVIVSSGQFNIGNTTTSTVGAHSHSANIGAFWVQGDSTETLEIYNNGTPIATVDPPATSSSTNGSHQHTLGNGTYPALINNGASGVQGITFGGFSSNAAGNHSHVFDIGNFQISQTEFTYEPLLCPDSPKNSDDIFGTPSGVCPGEKYHRIFVTSIRYNISGNPSFPPLTGEINGLAGADWQITFSAFASGIMTEEQEAEFINSNANALIYTAIFSDNQTSARDRITLEGRVFNMNNQLIASDHADLFDGTIVNPIQYDEFGNLVTTPEVWTGSASNGQATGDSCDNWMDSGSIGEYGRADEITPGWLDAGLQSCSNQGRLYGLSPAYTAPFILGDVNQDGVVNLLDVSPFIDRLSTGTFQAEADCNQDGVINLLDVSFFIDILSGG